MHLAVVTNQFKMHGLHSHAEEDSDVRSDQCSWLRSTYCYRQQNVTTEINVGVNKGMDP